MTAGEEAAAEEAAAEEAAAAGAAAGVVDAEEGASAEEAMAAANDVVPLDAAAGAVAFELSYFCQGQVIVQGDGEAYGVSSMVMVDAVVGTMPGFTISCLFPKFLLLALSVRGSRCSGVQV